MREVLLGHKEENEVVLLTTEQRLDAAERFNLYLCDMLMQMREEMETLRVQRLMMTTSVVDQYDRMRAH